MYDANRGRNDKVVKIAIHFEDGSIEEWTGEAARIFHKDVWWYLGETEALADFEPVVIPPNK